MPSRLSLYNIDEVRWSPSQQAHAEIKSRVRSERIINMKRLSQDLINVAGLVRPTWSGGEALGHTPVVRGTKLFEQFTFFGKYMTDSSNVADKVIFEL